MTNAEIKTITVKLYWYEAKIARGIARMRHAEAVRKSQKAQLERDIKADYVGAYGEMAFAKATNRYYQGEVNADGRLGGDVGDIEVRTRTDDRYGLIVRNYDTTEKLYALMYLKEYVQPNIYNPEEELVILEFKGWTTGRFAKQDKYLTQLKSGKHYVVPHCDLRSPLTIANLDMTPRL